MKVTEKSIRQQLDEINLAAADGDDELAHHLEDRLHQRVLQYVANGGMNARQFARLAMKSTRIDFQRYMA